MEIEINPDIKKLSTPIPANGVSLLGFPFEHRRTFAAMTPANIFCDLRRIAQTNLRIDKQRVKCARDLPSGYQPSLLFIVTRQIITCSVLFTVEDGALVSPPREKALADISGQMGKVFN